jgi:hypothetical protein
MGLQPTGVAMVHTPSTAGNPAPMYLYDVMLYIPGHSPGSNDGWFIESLPVTANHFAGTGIDGLIGRDVLDLGIMIYNGTAGQFTLAY